MICDFEKYIPWFIGYFFGTLIIYLVFPWSKKSGLKRISIHVIPLSVVIMYLVYEYNMLMRCTQMNIRIDIFLCWPLISTILVLYLGKMVFLKKNVAV